MKRRNWQLVALLFFLGFWLLTHLDSFFFKVLNFIAMTPLRAHAFAGNVLGFENWKKIITFINQPLTILIAAIITFIILLKIVKLIDRIFF